MNKGCVKKGGNWCFVISHSCFILLLFFWESRNIEILEGLKSHKLYDGLPLLSIPSKEQRVIVVVIEFMFLYFQYQIILNTVATMFYSKAT